MKLLSNPKKLMLIDGLGAVLSAFMLGFVLIQCNSFIGMPEHLLRGLSILASIYAIYSLYCYSQISQLRPIHFRLIAAANLFHSIFTLVLVIVNFHILATLGLIYFFVEILILCFIVFLELKVAKRIGANSQ